MSADNWTHCPRCRARGEAEYTKRKDGVLGLYGTVSVEEFDVLRAGLAEFRTGLDNARETFREDYEFYGAESGEVVASYSGSCSKCGLSTEFQYVHQIPKWNE